MPAWQIGSAMPTSAASTMFDFSGKVVLVTGATGGIGRVTSLLFAELGADLALVGRNDEKLRVLAAEVEAHGARAVPIVTDVKDPVACEAAITVTGNALGRLDVLVNNAGGSRAKPFDETELRDFDAMLALNLRGPWVLSMAARDLLAAHGGGGIVNISSMASVRAVEHSAPYGMAKAGLNNMTTVMAAALHRRNIRVNGLALGVIKTAGFYRSMDVMGIDASTVAGGPPEDVAWAIAFLASPASPHLNGVTIPLTGGLP